MRHPQPKTYVLAVEIPEGCDEFWDGVAKQKSRLARKMVESAIAGTLNECGWFDCRVKVALVRKGARR